MTDPWTQDPQVREDADLRVFLDELASTASEPVDPATRAATLERVLTAAAARPAAPPVPAWRRRVRQVLAMTGVKVVLAAGVAAATTGGLGAAGTLPDPAQHLLHDVGARVGIGFPDAPGQRKADGDPARDLAPGRLADQDGEEGSSGRTYAPGQVGREAQDPAPVVPLAPAEPPVPAEPQPEPEQPDTAPQDVPGRSGEAPPEKAGANPPGRP